MEDSDNIVTGEGPEEYPVSEYDLTSTPNDFNVLTITHFIESGVVKIPGFQRNYVWDLPKASKLIESLIIGLPVPQIFLYETERNSYLVIDGQQRLMTIYYFVKGRFPVSDKRIELRRIFSEQGMIPKKILNDDNYFANFSLYLKPQTENQVNKFHRKKYETLGEFKTSFELRTIRCITVKPAVKLEDDSAIYELFNRLNTTGVNLSSQEIRVSLYHSPFMLFLVHINSNKSWRRLMGTQIDLHMRDVEVLLRSFAMLIQAQNYKQPMTRFINNFSKVAKNYTSNDIHFYERIFEDFIAKLRQLPDDIFRTKNNKFSAVLFESVFYAACLKAFNDRNSSIIPDVKAEKIFALKEDPRFVELSTKQSTNADTVNKRLELAKQIIS